MARTKIKKNIYVNNRGDLFSVTMNRESLGGMYHESFGTLEEAEAHLDYINDTYLKEPNTGI